MRTTINDLIFALKGSLPGTNDFSFLGKAFSARFYIQVYVKRPAPVDSWYPFPIFLLKSFQGNLPSSRPPRLRAADGANLQ